MLGLSGRAPPKLLSVMPPSVFLLVLMCLGGVDVLGKGILQVGSQVAAT